MKPIKNIGIFAHVDAGKTSITENMLYLSGATKNIGSVDDGTTITDSLAVEKQRGISVRSSLTSFYWKEHKINLVDTPGHVDFSADVERVLQVIDAAILVISAVEGVQSHTESIWMALAERHIPVIIFVNKIDRLGVDLESILADISKELSPQFIPLQTVSNEGNGQAYLNHYSLADSEENIEKIANINDDILGLFLEETAIPATTLTHAFKEGVLQAQLFLMLFGSAKLQLGIAELLNAIIAYLPSPSVNADKELSALIYSTYHQEKLGKLAYVRIFEGSMQVRALVQNHHKNLTEKVTQLHLVLANNYQAIDTATAGDIVAVSGLTQSSTHDILGQPSEYIPKTVSLNTSLLTVQVQAVADKDYAALAHALQILSEEDPSLAFEWYREEKELHVKVMGWIQIEVLEQILLQRFNIAAAFKDPTVVYMETPKTSGYGIGHYTMPKPCWAIVRFFIEPAPLGSGIQYACLVRTTDVHQKYQNEVLRTIPKALQQGIKGWQVTDLKITLVQGEDHNVHSRPGNFVLATNLGIMNALNDIGTQFLEPIVAFKITASDELLGKITSEVLHRRGLFNSPEIQQPKMVLTGTIPLASSLDFPIWLSSLSGGKAKLITRFHSYAPCPDELAKVRAYKGVNPLDRSKYILKMRKALE